MLATIQNGLPVQNLSQSYSLDVQKFNAWLSGRRLSAETVTAYFSAAVDQYKPATVSRKKAALKKAIAQARGTALTLADSAQLTELFSKIKPGTPDPTVHEHEILNREELAELTEKSGQKTAAIITALYETAARVSELTALKVTDCQQRGETVYCEIRRGKGRKSRTVYLSKSTFDLLRSLYPESDRLVPLTRHSVHTLVKRAGGKIGRSDIHPHTLRHTKASHLLKGGLTLAAVSAYLGHSDGATTARYYLHDKPTAEAVLSVR